MHSNVAWVSQDDWKLSTLNIKPFLFNSSYLTLSPIELLSIYSSLQSNFGSLSICHGFSLRKRYYLTIWPNSEQSIVLCKQATWVIDELRSLDIQAFGNGIQDELSVWSPPLKEQKLKFWNLSSKIIIIITLILLFPDK